MHYRSPFYSTHTVLILRCKQETTNCMDLEKEVERKNHMFIILFILVFGIPLLKEAMEDAQYREECRRRGYDTYWSKTGCRYTSDNRKYDGKR